MSSTLDGWMPDVGSLVWQQMYDPQRPKHNSTIQERIAAGATYGTRFLTRVRAVTRNSDNTVRFHTKDDGCGHGMFPSRGHGDSWTNSDWCVLESAADVEGALW